MFEIGNLYSFETKAPADLGQGFSNLELVLITNYKRAARIRDVQAIHRAILGQLGEGAPANAEQLSYLVFENELGDEIVMAENWINPESVVSASAKTLTILIPNSTINDQRRWREILSQEGAKNFEITLA